MRTHTLDLRFLHLTRAIQEGHTGTVAVGQVGIFHDVLTFELGLEMAINFGEDIASKHILEGFDGIFVLSILEVSLNLNKVK